MRTSRSACPWVSGSAAKRKAVLTVPRRRARETTTLLVALVRWVRQFYHARTSSEPPCTNATHKSVPRHTGLIIRLRHVYVCEIFTFPFVPNVVVNRPLLHVHVS